MLAHVRYNKSPVREKILNIVEINTVVETYPGLASNSIAIKVEFIAVGIELSRIRTLLKSP